MIYLDYAATSIKRKEITAELLSNIDIYDGNPSSTHKLGRIAKKYLEEARENIARSINAKSNNIIFTSGASESNNTIINNFSNKGFEIISSKIEHKSILEALKNCDSKVILIDSDKNGIVDIEKIKKSITDNTKLIALMYVNNETGVIQKVKELGEYLKDRDIWFHVDAVQAMGHIDIDVEEIHCDSLSLSAHKLGAFYDFGILFTRKRIKSLIYGGNQEFNQRAGTSNVLSAILMFKVIDEVIREREEIKEIKKYFLDSIKEIPHEINGDINSTTNHIVNIYFPFVKSDLLITYLDIRDVYVSAGSACTAGTLEPSYVIENMYDKDRAKHSVRFSFGFTNTKEDIDIVVNLLKEIYNKKH